MYLNSCSFIGRLGQDPKSSVANGKTVCNFSIAVSAGEKSKTKLEWIRVVVWDKLADNCVKYLSKGKSVFVKGRLQSRDWQKDGTPEKVIELIAYNIQFLSSIEKAEDKRDVPMVENGTYDDVPF